MLYSDKKEEFSALFDKYYRRLYNYSFSSVRNKELCEELVQDSFIKLWEHIETLKRDNKPIEGFLFVTLKNKIIDAYRRKRSRDRHEGLFILEQSVGVENDLEWDLIARIDKVYAALPKKTVEIFQLSRVEGLTYNEIAQRMSIAVKTVEAHISRALNAFRRGLKDFL